MLLLLRKSLRLLLFEPLPVLLEHSHLLACLRVPADLAGLADLRAQGFQGFQGFREVLLGQQDRLGLLRLGHLSHQQGLRDLVGLWDLLGLRDLLGLEDLSGQER